MWATLLVVAVTALVALLLFLVWNRYAKQKAAIASGMARKRMLIP